MAVIDVVAAKVRPLNNAVIRRMTAGAAVSVGDAVYVASSGKVQPTDADFQLLVQAIGVVIGVGVSGATSAGDGDVVDVVTHGAVELGNATAMTPGTVVYISPTAGKMDQVAPGTGDFNFVIGRALTGTTLYVQPQMTVPAANP
jgi:hypothetical protein